MVRFFKIVFVFFFPYYFFMDTSEINLKVEMRE